METSSRLSAKLERLLIQHGACVSGTFVSDRQLHQIARSVKTLSDYYTKGGAEGSRDLFKDSALLQAYLIYYLPVNLVKLFAVLDELACQDFSALFPGDEIRILDIGCGPGTYLLGFLEYLKKNKRLFPATTTISWVGLDRSGAALSAAKHLLDDYLAEEIMPGEVTCTGSFHHAQISPACIRTEIHRLGTPFHVIILGNILAELPLQDIPPLLDEIISCMAPNGILIVIDPGTKKAFRTILNVRQTVLQKHPLFVYAPCLTTGPCPLYSHSSEWCHASLYWQPPAIVDKLDALLPFDKRKGVAYSYLVCTKKQLDRCALFTGVPREHIWRIVSSRICTKGEERMYVCNGLNRVLVRRMKRNCSHINEDFSGVRRGDLVWLQDYEPRGHFYDITKNTLFRRLAVG